MSRINTNVTALIGARILNANNAGLNKSLEKLSSGLRINRGADDPAGLIASENLRKQIRGTETAIKNAERADTMVSIAEGALGEVGSLLLDMQALLGEVANKGGMSTEEIDANQMQVDSIINSIDRIANSTEFEGIKLLNGNEAYTETHTTADIAELTINAAKLIGGDMAVAINQTVQATRGTDTITGPAAGVAGASVTLQLSSNRGTTELTFADATAIADMEDAINAVSAVTGVEATTDGSGVLTSVDYGTDAYVTAEVTSTGTIAGLLGDKQSGVNAVATVNGVAATGNGKILNVRTGVLDIEVDLDASFGVASTLITITGGGADFALGATVDAIGLESIGIPNIASGQLGNSTDGYLSTLKSGGVNNLSSENLYTAQDVLSEAIKDVSKLRGRLGSFQKNTLATTINSLRITGENLMAADSAIRDTDFASETSNLTRGQILVQAATAVLAQANTAPQSVLQLI
jgi:flagellin